MDEPNGTWVYLVLLLSKTHTKNTYVMFIHQFLLRFICVIFLIQLIKIMPLTTNLSNCLDSNKCIDDEKCNKKPNILVKTLHNPVGG